MAEEKQPVNRELILREKLAIERTKMSNDRTILSFLRTSLYFSIAGMTIKTLVKLPYGSIAEVIFWILAAIILIAGIVKYVSGYKRIRACKKHIGYYLLEATDDEF